jgi:hypothetical protein
MVDEVVAVEVDGAVAALETIERFAGSSFSSTAVSNWVIEARLLVYLPQVSLRGFEVGPDIDLAAQGNRKQEKTEVDLREK